MVKKINEFRELQKKKGKKGFSMIELIIVIAIMAILVALIGTQLIPYLEKSRENRDKTTLDTCVTAFESAMADYEVVLSSNASLSDGESAAVAAGANANDFTKTFENYAGIDSTDTTVFKSDKGKTYAAKDIEFIITTDGVITGAQVGASGSELVISR